MARPVCTLHPNGRVKRDGYYGRGEARYQRWKCMPDNEDRPHLIAAGELSVQLVGGDEGACRHCERDWAEGEGMPQGTGDWFIFKQKAEALVHLAEGGAWSLRRAGQQARRRAGRQARRARRGAVRYSRNGRMAGDWVPQYAPVIVDAMRERGVLPTHWPQTITADSFDVRVKALRPNGRPLQGGRSIYHVFVAVGYPEGQKGGRLWHVAAFPKNNERCWAEFFGQLHGEPEVLVADRDANLRRGAERAFLNTQYFPCTWHLMETVREVLWRAQMNSSNELLYRLVRPDTFADPWAWVAFRRTLNDYLSGEHQHFTFRQIDGLLSVHRWVQRNEPEIQRCLFTAHRPDSNGLAEEHLRMLGAKLGDRRRNFRNLPRLNWLLKLMMLHQLDEADEDDWALILRDNHLAHDGKPPPRRYTDGQVIQKP